MSPNMTTVYGDGEDGSGEYILADLIKFKKYTVVVQAFNEVGNGPLSEPTTAQTMEDGTARLFLSVRPLTNARVMMITRTGERNHIMRTFAGDRLILSTIITQVTAVSPAFDARCVERNVCGNLTAPSLALSRATPLKASNTGVTH